MRNRACATVLGGCLAILFQGSSAAADEAVLDPKSKIAHKIIVIGDPGDPQKNVAAVRERPGDMAPVVEEPLKAFTIRYRLKVTEEDAEEGKFKRVKPLLNPVDPQSAEDKEDPDFVLLDADGRRWFKVGANLFTRSGWVDASQVALWKTRSALEPRAQRTLEVFPTKERSGTPAKNQSGKSDDYTSLAMVLEPADSKQDPSYPVIFYVGPSNLDDKGAAPISKQAIEMKNFETAKAEICFVIDTTRSMTPLLDGVKTVAREVAEGLSSGAGRELRDRFRFGLVEYQDNSPGLTPARVSIPLTDVDAFVRKLAAVTVTELPSEETKEDVVAGLLMATLGDADSRKPSDRVGWTENSSKHVILLGDASAHTGDKPRLGPDGQPERDRLTGQPTSKNSTGLSIPQLLLRCRPHQTTGPEAGRGNFHFHAVLALNPGDPEDWPLAKADFHRVAENGGQFKGYDFELKDPDSPQDRAAIVKELLGMQLLLQSSVSNPQALARDVAAGKTLPPAAAAIWMLYPGAEPERQVHRGWASPKDAEQKEVANECLYVTYEDLKRLRGALRHMQDLMDVYATNPQGRKANAKEFLEKLKGAFSTTHTGQPLDENTSLAEFISGIPLQNPTLQFTIGSLIRMDDQQFREFLKAIEISTKLTTELIDSPDGWVVLDAETNEKFKFLPLQTLP